MAKFLLPLNRPVVLLITIKTCAHSFLGQSIPMWHCKKFQIVQILFYARVSAKNYIHTSTYVTTMRGNNSLSPPLVQLKIRITFPERRLVSIILCTLETLKLMLCTGVFYTEIKEYVFGKRCSMRAPLSKNMPISNPKYIVRTNLHYSIFHSTNHWSWRVGGKLPEEQRLIHARLLHFMNGNSCAGSLNSEEPVRCDGDVFERKRS